MLLTTKLYPAPARPGRVLRSRLIARLHEDRPLTLIAAPAGFGKTTLLAAWLADKTESRGLRNEFVAASLSPQPSSLSPRVAWLALDADDNDPARFLTYLSAALDPIKPGVHASIHAILQSSGASPAVKVALTYLINSLDDLPDPCVLILDDYHVIDSQPVHEALTYLLDHLPARLRVILTSRADPPLPLSRWRVRHQLAELRADDLRFTPDEAAAFLNQVMGLNLSAAQIAALEMRTEGWIAGLQLAALALQSHPDVASFIGAFGGSNRYIADYLMDEVLSRQSETRQSFLFQTSILTRMCGGLCEAVTGQAESQATLEQLEQANLFVVALDHQRQWFRYHHLFADVLQYRLRQAQRDVLPELHGRASQWFEQNEYIPEAVQHALAAKDYERAAHQIEVNALKLVLAGGGPTIRGWLNALPPDLRRPRLSLAKAVVALNLGHASSLEEDLQEAERLLAPSSPEDARGMRAEIAAVRTVGTSFYTETAQVFQFAQAALADLPEHAGPLRLSVTTALAHAHFQAGDLAAAEQAAALVLVSPSPAPIFMPRLTSQLALGMVRRCQGRLREDRQLCEPVLAALGGEHPLPSSLTARVSSELGILAYEQNQLEQAEHYFDLARMVSEELSYTPGQVHACAGLARVAQARSDTLLANTLMAQAEDLLKLHPAPSSRLIVETLVVSLWLAQDWLETASRWAESQAAIVAVPRESLNPLDYRGLMAARVWIACGQAERASELLTRLHQEFETHGHHQSAFGTLATLALAWRALGRSAEALADLERALAAAEPEGYVRLFVDDGEPMRLLLAELRSQTRSPVLRAYAERLLAAFGPPISLQQSAIVNLIEPLSERELEVLRHIADGLTNHDIADRLVVVHSTVKKHVNSIFGKLGATHRAQAIARARDLGLL